MMNPYRFLATSDHMIARAARRARQQVRELTLPAPRPIVLPMRLTYEAAREAYYYGARVLVCEPLFKSYCKEFGKGVRTGNFIHYIVGRGDLIVGDDVLLDGKINIHFAARFSDSPTLRIGDGTGIGHECKLTIGKAITIGKNCRIAGGVFIFDSSGHPSNPEEREQGLPPAEEDVRPVTIEDNVWIGTRAIISPGVTIGEGSVVSAGSVVLADVPPYTVVAGNPARRVSNLRGTNAANEPPPSRSFAKIIGAGEANKNQAAAGDTA
jgi:acetyltransferase-like isoleucine patch superfamily enzyme